MTGAERGFLLLGSHLGNPERKVLTIYQLRTLSQRVKEMPYPAENRNLGVQDLCALGYGLDFARRILGLLEEEDLLDHYLRRAAKQGYVPLTRAGARYPRKLLDKLGLDAPGCLWARGDLSILDGPKISLVGSRELLKNNREFAEEVGHQAACQGYTLVSGNARGADRVAQNACLAAGGRVISIVADELSKQPLRENMLYLSEEDYDENFSALRALRRNRCIHALGEKTFIAQCGYQTGGTWDGTVKNLRFGWSPVFAYADGSAVVTLLVQMGAQMVDISRLDNFSSLQSSECSFL